MLCFESGGNKWRINADLKLFDIDFGDAVKVGVLMDEDKESHLMGERFWAVVSGVDGDLFTSTVENDLVATHIHGLQRGSRIVLDRACILEIET